MVPELDEGRAMDATMPTMMAGRRGNVSDVLGSPRRRCGAPIEGRQLGVGLRLRRRYGSSATALTCRLKLDYRNQQC